MDYTVETSPMIGSKSGTNIPAGSYDVPINNLEYYKIYTWYVNVTDGENWRREKYHFTTVSENVILLYPTDDTKIRALSPDKNYGSSPMINVRNHKGQTNHNWEHDILCKFDLSSIQSNININYAKLNLFYYDWKDHNPKGRVLTAYKILEPWDELTVTWDTKPNILSVLSASAVVPDNTNNWISWDVTDDVIEFSKGRKTNYGWQLMDEKDWNSVNVPFTNFYSKEYGDLIPYLEIGT